ADRGAKHSLRVDPAAFNLERAGADENGTRRAQRDELVGIDGQVVRGQRSRILDEVARHPMVLAGAGDVLDELSEVPAVQLGPALAGRGDEGDGEPWVVRHGDEGGLPVSARGPRCPPAGRRRTCRSRSSPGPGSRPTPTRAARPNRRAGGAGPG